MPLEIPSNPTNTSSDDAPPSEGAPAPQGHAPVGGARLTSTAPARKPKRKPGKWRKRLPYAVIAGLAAAIIYGLIPKPIPVETVAVATGELTVSVLEEGKTRLRNRFVISPPVSGYLKRVELRAGDRIEAGKTVLATIQAEPASFLNPRARGESEARLKGAQAAQMRAQSEMERMTASLDLARKDLKRSAALKVSGAISAKEWDTAENQVQVLERELRGAEFGLRVAQFEVSQAEATLQSVESPGSSGAAPYRVIAPVSGAVLNVNEENARIIAAGTPIMEVGDLTDMEAEIELLSSDAVGVHPGASVSIEQWGGDHPLRAQVSTIEPGGYTKVSALGVEEQRVKVRVNFLDPFPPATVVGDRFRVEARIVTWHAPKVLLVPTGALFRRGGDWMAFVVSGDRAQAQKVEIAHNNGIAAEVRSGLSEGQRVIVHPPDVIADGKRVHP